MAEPDDVVVEVLDGDHREDGRQVVEAELVDDGVRELPDGDVVDAELVGEVDACPSDRAVSMNGHTHESAGTRVLDVGTGGAEGGVLDPEVETDADPDGPRVDEAHPGLVLEATAPWAWVEGDDAPEPDGESDRDVPFETILAPQAGSMGSGPESSTSSYVVPKHARLETAGESWAPGAAAVAPWLARLRRGVLDALDDAPSAPRPLLADPGDVVDAEATAPGDAAATVPLRLALAVVSLTALLAGAIGWFTGIEPLRVGGILVFGFIGIGSAPWQLHLSLGSYPRLALSFLTSMAAMTLIPFEMLVLDEWHPALALGLLVSVCAPLHVLGILAVVTEWRFAAAAGSRLRLLPRPVAAPTLREEILRALPSVGLAVVGAATCLVTALTHHDPDPGFYGFLPRIGPVWYVGLAAVLLAFILGVDRPYARAVPVFLLVVVLTLTPALVYGEPRVQAAAKHVDFVLQIQQLHALDTPIAVYNAWSGFFAAMAWLCQVAGIDDPMRLATYWPALLAVFRVIVLRYMFGQLLPRAAQCWIAVTLAVLADSIGSDYFSPQSLGFVVGMAAIGLALSYRREEPRLLMMFVAGLVLAVSHQFSPYAVGAALVVLVVFRQVRPWWTPALVLGPAVVWALVNASALRGVLNFGEIGRAGNFRPPVTQAAQGLQRLPVIRETVLALLIGIAVLAVVAGINVLRHRTDRRYWALICCPLAGLTLIAVNPYGQEGIFRAALFGLPWLAALAAPVLASPRIPFRLVLGWTSACLTGAFLVSSFGLDGLNVIRVGDLAAIRYFEQHGGPRPPTTHYMLLLGAGDLPTTPGLSGGWHQTWSRDRIYEPLPDRVPVPSAAAQVNLLTSRLIHETADPSAPPTLFAMWSPVSAEFGRAYALQTPQQAAALRDAFASSRYWSVAFERDGTYVFRFEPSRYPGTQR